MTSYPRHPNAVVIHHSIEDLRSAEPNRMQTSEPQLGSPANNQVVEGASEIDICFDHDEFLVYVEAKLGSDISLTRLTIRSETRSFETSTA